MFKSKALISGNWYEVRLRVDWLRKSDDLSFALMKKCVAPGQIGRGQIKDHRLWKKDESSTAVATNATKPIKWVIPTKDGSLFTTDWQTHTWDLLGDSA
jgi:hypothetical protein